MNFEVVGDITEVDTFAVGTSIRELSRLRRAYGAGRWRKRKRKAKRDSHQIWRTQRVQVNVASLRLFLRSSMGPNRAFEPQSLESLGRIRGGFAGGGFAGSEPFSGFRSRKPETDPDACHSTPITRPSPFAAVKAAQD